MTLLMNSFLDKNVILDEKQFLPVGFLNSNSSVFTSVENKCQIHVQFRNDIV